MSLKILMACLLMWTAAIASAPQTSSYDPAGRHLSRSSSSFLDFALQQLNPESRDYGRLLEDCRRIAVENTFKSAGFWIAFAAIAGCLGLFTLFWHEYRLRLRQEIIAANFLAMYHNAWVEARTGLELANEQFNELAQKLNRVMEHHPKPPEAGTDTKPAASAPQPVFSPACAGLSTASNAMRRRQHEESPSAAERPDGPQVKPKRDNNQVALLAQVSTLQQQLNASHEREKHLQKELEKAQRRAGRQQPQSLHLFEPTGSTVKEEVPHAGEVRK